MMNETIERLLQHRSIRKFADKPVSEEQTEWIIRCAQMASSSSHIQAYTVIRITDPGIRRQLREVTGNQMYVEECPLFLVWCADLYRLEEAIRMQGKVMRHEGIEPFITATIDAALAAQNAAVAAESMGLGIVYIGSLRNDPAKVARLLKLPPRVYPVFGMCIGYPAQEPSLRPRLPMKAVFHDNSYDPSRIREQLEQYDAVMAEYYAQRTGGKKQTTWTREMAAKYAQPNRPGMKTFLEQQGFQLD